jgi:DNA-binding MarR family transcriptional regulator
MLLEGQCAGRNSTGRVGKKMKPRPTHREKTLRAFRAYLGLLDASEWIRGETRGQLEGFGLTIRGFRVMDMLYRHGPMYINAIARGCQLKRQNVEFVIERLEENGWVRGEVARLEPVENQSNRLARAHARAREQGLRVKMIRLTPLGEKFIGRTFPKHAKVIKSLMMVLDGREQETLARLCQKLKEGDIIKFVKEIQFVDEDEITETWPKG